MEPKKIALIVAGVAAAIAIPTATFFLGRGTTSSTTSPTDGTTETTTPSPDATTTPAPSGGGSTATTLRNVMYYSDWSIWGGQENFYPQDLPTEYFTHLNYAFLDFDAQGNLIFPDPDAPVAANLGQEGVTWGDANAGILPVLRAQRALHPNVKLGISVGGWSKSADFPLMAADDTARANFVANMMKYLEYTDFDYVDIDWEYPGIVRQGDSVDNSTDEGNPHASPADKANYILLLSDLRTALDQQGERLGKTYELSVALPMDEAKLTPGVDLPQMFQIIDFANMMTYDARGAFDTTSGHHTPLYGNPADPLYDAGYSVDQMVTYLLSQGVPSEKIVVGAAFYSRGWKNIENTQIAEGLPGLFAPASATALDADSSSSMGALNDLPTALGDGGRNGGIWAYRNHSALHAAYPNLVEYWDDVAKAPYLYNGSAFFTYDNPQSLAEKANYVRENNLGGMISWQASNDAVTDTPNQRDELTKAIYNGLYGTTPLPQHEIVTAPLNIGCTVTPVAQGYEITLWNHETSVETHSVLQALETQQKTLLHPKLYLDNGGIPLMAGTYNAGQVYQEEGFTVVDLATVYESKTIKPGYAVVFQLHHQDTTPVSVSNLASVTLAQRHTTTGADLSRQTVYGAGATTLPESTPTAPTTPTPTAPTTPTTPTSPESTPAPSLDNVLTWNRQDEAVGVYTPGTVVTHNGKTYHQVGSAVAWWAEPGTDPSFWQEIS